MPLVPPCASLGRQCTSLPVTIRVGTFEDDDPYELDHDGTWMLGHTERVSFGKLYVDDDDLLVDAVIHVPCRYFKASNGTASCAAHGFTGRTPPERRLKKQPRQLGRDRFVVMDKGRLTTRRLPMPARSLPIVHDNPCVGAPCRTSDNTREGACCRDLQIEILCTERQTKLEALLRTRKAPYLCKVEREDDEDSDSVEAEIISACGYLEDGSVACTLHGRKRADGRTAKPSLCFDWPPRDPNLHPGCVFLKRRRRSKSR